MMDEVKFLYECVKAGKLSNAEAKEFLSSGGSSESRERGQQLKQIQVRMKQIQVRI